MQADVEELAVVVAGPNNPANMSRLEALRGSIGHLNDCEELEMIKLKKAVGERVSLCEATFVNFDKNGDGLVTADEIVHYLLSVRPKKRPRVFPDKLKEVNPYRKKHVMDVLEQMDEDHDGRITMAEFQIWWQNETQLEEEDVVVDGFGRVSFSHSPGA